MEEIYHNLSLLLNNSTEYRVPWEVNRQSATQDIPCILCNPNVHCHLHNYKSPVPILRQINPFLALPFHLRSILILFSHARLRLPSSLFPIGFQNKAYVQYTCPPHVPRTSHNSLLWV